MITRFFRSFFWAILLGLFCTWFYLGVVSASTRELILVEDKFDGIRQTPVFPGEWTFVSSRIVPGRVTLHRIFIGPRTLIFRYKKGLSQSEMLGLDDSYFIQTDLRLEYNIDPLKSRKLFLELDSPDWNRLNSYLEFRVRLVMDQFIKQNYKNDQDIPGLEDKIYNYFNSKESLTALSQNLASIGIRFTRSIPVRVFVPDLGRYQAILNLGEKTLLDLKLDRLKKINEARIQHDAAGIANKAYFTRLEYMGQLLKRYPDLKEYVSLGLMGDQVQVMIVPSSKWMQSGLEPDSIGILKQLKKKNDESRTNKKTPFLPKLPGERKGQFTDLTPP